MIPKELCCYRKVAGSPAALASSAVVKGWDGGEDRGVRIGVQAARG